MDISNDVDLEGVNQVLLELFWLLSTAICQLTRFQRHDLGDLQRIESIIGRPL